LTTIGLHQVTWRLSNQGNCASAAPFKYSVCGSAGRVSKTLVRLYRFCRLRCGQPARSPSPHNLKP